MAFARCSTELAKAASISRSLPAFRVRSATSNERAAACTSLACDSEVGFRGLMRKPITLALGNSSRSNSNRFAPSVLTKNVTHRDVAAGTIETGNETEFHGIGASRENDWDSGRCSFGGHCCRRGERNNYGHGVGHQLGGQCWQSVKAPVR